MAFAALIDALRVDVPLSFILTVHAIDLLFVCDALCTAAPSTADTPWALRIVLRLSFFDVTVLVAFVTPGTILPEVRPVHLAALALGKVSVVLKSGRLDAEGTEELKCVECSEFAVHNLVVLHTILTLFFELFCQIHFSGMQFFKLRFKFLP